MPQSPFRAFTVVLVKLKWLVIFAHSHCVARTQVVLRALELSS